jgi:hypothetical protein
VSTAEAFAPDFAEAIEVWRAWRVVRRGSKYQLGSVLKPTLWPQGEPLVAECLHPEPLARRVWRRTDLRHPSPELRCDCGIYGAGLERLGEYLTVAPFEHVAARVLGRVSLWGTVIECQRGYRASQAYPSSIYVPIDAARDEHRVKEVAADLADYGVPVELIFERSCEAPLAIAHLLAHAREGRA